MIEEEAERLVDRILAVRGLDGSDYDLLNKALLDAEAALRELKPGVSARVVIEEDHEYAAWLCFGKLRNSRWSGGRWSLFIEVAGRDEAATQHHIASASLERRLRAAAMFGELLHEILDKTEGTIQKVREATELARAFADAADRATAWEARLRSLLREALPDRRHHLVSGRGEHERWLSSIVQMVERKESVWLNRLFQLAVAEQLRVDLALTLLRGSWPVPTEELWARAGLVKYTRDAIVASGDDPDRLEPPVR